MLVFLVMVALNPPPCPAPSCRNCADSLETEQFLQLLCRNGQLDSALDVLSGMRTSPSRQSYMCLLKACNKVRSLPHATHIHTHLTRLNAPLNGLLGDHLVAMLANCGAIEHARQILLASPHRSLSSWTALTSAYVGCGRGEEALRLHQHMQRENVEPNTRMFISLFKACGSIPDLVQGKKLHADAHRKGLTADIFVGNTLVSMYGKCRAISDAEDAFCALSERSIVSWNVMLSAYAEQCQGEKVLRLYRQMQEEGPSPDTHTLVLTLQACGTIRSRQEKSFSDKQSSKVASFGIGQALHAYALKKELGSSAFIGNTLVSFYGKCGAVAAAESAFNALSKHSVVSWTSMLSAYVENDQGEKALHCYKQMQQEGVNPDKVACTIALQACGALAKEEEAVLVKDRAIKSKALEIGKALHAGAFEMCYASDTCVGTSIISMYGKCGALAEAEEAFGMLHCQDVVSWNAMLSAYVEHGKGEKALCLYSQMHMQSLALDEVTLICILQACSELGSLVVCEELHFTIVSTEQEKLPSLTATLIHAYGNCGSTLGAQAIFWEVIDPDLVSWTAVIAGFAGEGNDPATLQLLERLRLVSVSPDEVIFTSVLTACSHAGLVVEALECLEFMIRDHKMTPKLMHYGVMTDLFGRVGDFKRLENMLCKMPMQADMAIWWFLLGACRTHGNLELAKQTFGHTVNLQPKQATAYILMSNIYAAACLPDCAREVENLRQKQGLPEVDWLQLD